MSGPITRREEDGIIELRLDRPDKKNALTSAMYQEMTATLRDASARADIACVLFTGTGNVFCAGNDIQDFLETGGAAAALELIQAFGSFDKPIVAAVGGHAVGVGVTLLLHCDLVYAAPGVRLSVPFASIGIVPEAASSLLLPARIGLAKASEMLLLGIPITSEEAERHGLVTALVPEPELYDHALARARALVAAPPQALAATRALIRREPEPIAARMLVEAEALRTALQGEESKEAFTAFLEKRPPVFRRGGAA